MILICALSLTISSSFEFSIKNPDGSSFSAFFCSENHLQCPASSLAVYLARSELFGYVNAMSPNLRSRF